MRRRLYFLVSELSEAHKIFNGLLIKRVPINHIHVLAKDGVDTGDLPTATAFQKFDILHSMIIGMCIGAIIGIITGIIVHNLLDVPIGGGMIAALLIGAVLGGWSASMIGMMVPNRHLKQFHKSVDEGKLLLIAEVKKERVKEIESYVHKLDPKAHYEGVEPTIPGFP